MFIREVKPRLIKNSRGERTVEIVLKTYEGRFVCSAPSGKSKGRSEVVCYNRRGIDRSIVLLRAFCKKLVHKNFMIKRVDELKSLVEMVKRFEARNGKMGGNVSYVLEGVFLKAAAADNNMELWEFINKDVNFGKKVKMPHAVGNCIGGGLHSSDAWGKKPDFQEFLLIPRAKSFSHGVSLNIRAYRYAKKLLKSRKVNDENALRTGKTNEETLEILKRVGKKYKVRIGLDVAASSFYKGGYYFYRNKELTRDKTDQVDYIERLIRKFNIFYVEDGMQEEDFSGFKSLVGSVDGKKLIVGDDLTTTNMKLVRRAIESKAVNAVVIKPNQIGSMIEVRRVVMFCKKHGVKTVFSHRSGETMDDILADYSVGFGGDFIKTGIMGRERLIKLKRVMEIEKTLFSK